MAAGGLRTSGATDDGEEFYFAAEQHLGRRYSPSPRVCKMARYPTPSPTVAASMSWPCATTAARPEDYSEARDQVLAGYRTDEIARMRAGTDRFLRERADVQIAKGLQ